MRARAGEHEHHLLGGALALLAGSMSDEAIVHILENAIASVQSGELRQKAS